MLRNATDRAGYEPGSLVSNGCETSTWSRSPRSRRSRELREAFAHAYLLGTICRVLTWDLILGRQPRAVAEGLGNPVEAWLGIFRGVRGGTTTLGGA